MSMKLIYFAKYIIYKVLYFSIERSQTIGENYQIMIEPIWDSEYYTFAYMIIIFLYCWILTWCYIIETEFAFYVWHSNLWFALKFLRIDFFWLIQFTTLL